MLMHRHKNYINTIPFDRRPAIELLFAERCQLRKSVYYIPRFNEVVRWCERNEIWIQSIIHMKGNRTVVAMDSDWIWLHMKSDCIWLQPLLHYQPHHLVTLFTYQLETYRRTVATVLSFVFWPVYYFSDDYICLYVVEPAPPPPPYDWYHVIIRYCINTRRENIKVQDELLNHCLSWLATDSSWK